MQSNAKESLGMLRNTDNTTEYKGTLRNAKDCKGTLRSAKDPKKC